MRKGGGYKGGSFPGKRKEVKNRNTVGEKKLPGGPACCFSEERKYTKVQTKKKDNKCTGRYNSYRGMCNGNNNGTKKCGQKIRCEHKDKNNYIQGGTKM